MTDEHEEHIHEVDIHQQAHAVVDAIQIAAREAAKTYPEWDKVVNPENQKPFEKFMTDWCDMISLLAVQTAVWVIGAVADDPLHNRLHTLADEIGNVVQEKALQRMASEAFIKPPSEN